MSQDLFPGAVERWQAIIRARAAQMDAAYAALGRTSHDFWSRRASAFHRATRDTATSDPIFPRLRRAIGPRTTVLDVGAGTGRFVVALAPLAARVTAVEPNAHMRAYLGEEIASLGLHNVDLVDAEWQDPSVDLRADVVLCSHVLYPILDVEGFLRKLDRSAGRQCFVYLRADHPDRLTSPLWERFHGEPRRLSPTYVAAVDVLAEMGIYADVEVVPHAPSWRWDSLDDATDEFLETLILADTPANRAELRRLLQDFLVERDSALVLPTENLPNAIITWRPRQPSASSIRSPA